MCVWCNVASAPKPMDQWYPWSFRMNLFTCSLPFLPVRHASKCNKWSSFFRDMLNGKEKDKGKISDLFECQLSLVPSIDGRFNYVSFSLRPPTLIPQSQCNNYPLSSLTTRSFTLLIIGGHQLLCAMSSFRPFFEVPKKIEPGPRLREKDRLCFFRL